MKKPQQKQKSILNFKDKSFFDEIINALLTFGKVKVTGFGIFEIRTISSREGYNVGNGKRIMIPEYQKVVFKPAKYLKVIFNAKN